MRRYNEEFGTALTPDLVDHWDAMTTLTHFETTSEFWDWSEQSPHPRLFRDLDIVPGALETLNRLSHNHQIVIITTKPPWATHDTFSWIGESELPTREVHITGRKWTVDCDIYLDDGPHNLEALVDRRPDRTVCRFIQPWNEPVDGTVDVDSWDTFEALVQRQWC